MTRVIFMGSPELATPSLEALLSAPGVEVVAVFSQPDRPTGRGRKMQPCAVKAEALAHGLLVHTPEKIAASEAVPMLDAAAADLAIVCAYGHILPERVLRMFPLGCFNLHFSLLPRWRGASPVQAAILAGDSHSGVSLQSMVRELDAGPIITETAPIPIGAEETAGELAQRLARAGAELLKASMPILLAGSPPLKNQDHAKATFCRTIQKEAGLVNFSTESAIEIGRKVRAYHPWPGCHTFLDGRRFGLVRVQAVETPENTLEPAPQKNPLGALDRDGWVTAFGGGRIKLLEVKPEGKRAMAWEDYLRGAPETVGKQLLPQPE